MKFVIGKNYLLVNSAGTSLVKVVGSPTTFSSLIRVMSLKDKREWYERKYLLKPIKSKQP